MEHKIYSDYCEDISLIEGIRMITHEYRGVFV